jgi:hypothetical protein
MKQQSRSDLVVEWVAIPGTSFVQRDTLRVDVVLVPAEVLADADVLR